MAVRAMIEVYNLVIGALAYEYHHWRVHGSLCLVSLI